MSVVPFFPSLQIFSLTALVKSVYTGDVVGTHLFGISKVQLMTGPSKNGRTPVSGEGVFRILHDGFKVISSSQVVSLHLLEVVFVSWLDVFSVDVDMLVSVRAGVLVAKAQSMENLMLYSGYVQTAGFFQGDFLFPSPTAHFG